jgi:hypothetical protein
MFLFIYGASTEISSLNLLSMKGYFGTKHPTFGMGEPLPLAPDFGPAYASERHGVVAVGAVPWVTNFNVLIDLSTTTAQGQQHASLMGQSDGVDDELLLRRCKRIARAVSERGGGLQRVQALALKHSGGVEVACNLLDVDVTGTEAVLARVKELIRLENTLEEHPSKNMRVRESYCTNKTEQELLESLRIQ